MKFFQNFAPQFPEKERESRHELHQLVPMRIISDHGSVYAKATADKLHGCHGWDIRVSPATPEPRAKAGHSEFGILQTIPSRSPQNTSPGDPAAAGPLNSPQSKSWMTTGMVPQTTIRKQNQYMKTHTRIALALVASLMASTAWAQNGTWTAYPGQSATYQAAIQQPINADGSSKFKANGNAVIPVKFALSQGTGAFVFESIYFDNPANTANDFSFLSFTPSTPVTFNDITTLSAVYAFTLGNCHGGALRWSVRTSATQSVFIYYGDYPNFTDCTTSSQAGANMIGLADLRYDTSQYPGGTFYDNYAHAQTLVGTSPIIRVSLVLDAGWGGDQRLTLTSATVNTDTFMPQPASPPIPVCPTSVAYIGITKTGAAPVGAVNEPQTIQPRDEDGMFRIVDCKYMYNLATSSLMGVGTYDVVATIDGTTFDVATFSLK